MLKRPGSVFLLVFLLGLGWALGSYAWESGRALEQAAAVNREQASRGARSVESYLAGLRQDLCLLARDSEARAVVSGRASVQEREELEEDFEVLLTMRRLNGVWLLDSGRRRLAGRGQKSGEFQPGVSYQAPWIVMAVPLGDGWVVGLKGAGEALPESPPGVTRGLWSGDRCLLGSPGRSEPFLEARQTLREAPWLLISQVSRDRVLAEARQQLKWRLELGLALAGLAWLLARLEAQRDRAQVGEWIDRAAADPVLVLDRGLRILQCNKRFLEVYGYTRAEARGLTLPPPPGDCLLYETQHQRADGSLLEVEVHMRQYRDSGWLCIVRDNSERKTLHRRLAQSELMGRTGAFELDLGRGTLWASEGLRLLLGLEDEPLGPDSLSQMIHPEDRERCAELLSGRVVRSHSVELECRMVPRIGPLRSLHFRLEELDQKVMGAVQDVTARTSAMEALRHVRERYRLGLRHAPVVVFEEDLHQHATWVDKLEPGSSPEESLHNLVPAEVLAHLGSIRDRVLTEGLPHREELRFHRGGILQCYDLYLDCRCDAHGNTVGLMAAVLDLGTQRRAEEEARLLRTALDQSPLGVAVTDAAGRVQYLNQRYQKLCLPAENGQVLPYFQCQLTTADELYSSFLNGRSWTGELGDRLLSLTPVSGGHFALLVHDLSESNRRRDELEQTRSLLAQSQKMEAVGRLAGGMAHDFNNLLAVIQGNCSLLLDDLGHNQEAAELLGQVLGASQRGACLTRQLLTFSRCHRQEWKEFDLNEALTEFVPLLDRVLGEKVRLSLECASELLPLHGDRGHLEQILLNLVINARDAMPQGGDLRIRTRTMETSQPVLCRSHELAPGSYLVLEVSDTGCGMSPETLNRIFEPFFTTKPDGNGLGLATTFGLVGDLKGGLQVASAPGRGTTFRLILPRLLESAPPELPVSPPVETNLEGCRVLLVEDLPDLRRLLDRLLRCRGFDVVTAGSAEEALELFPMVTPRVVVSDLMLPGANGVELAHNLAAQDPCLRVLLMSGYGAELDPAGFPFMSKPFTPDQLVRKLQEVLAA